MEQHHEETMAKIRMEKKDATATELAKFWKCSSDTIRSVMRAAKVPYKWGVVKSCRVKLFDRQAAQQELQKHMYGKKGGGNG